MKLTKQGQQIVEYMLVFGAVVVTVMALAPQVGRKTGDMIGSTLNELKTDIHTYSWEKGDCSACSVACGGGTQNCTPVCKRSDGREVAVSFCEGPAPAIVQACNTQPCPIDCQWEDWAAPDWGECVPACGVNRVLTQTRSISVPAQFGGDPCDPADGVRQLACADNPCPGICGNGICEPGEQTTCPEDCGCEFNYYQLNECGACGGSYCEDWDVAWHTDGTTCDWIGNHNCACGDGEKPSGTWIFLNPLSSGNCDSSGAAPWVDRYWVQAGYTCEAVEPLLSPIPPCCGDGVLNGTEECEAPDLGVVPANCSGLPEYSYPAELKCYSAVKAGPPDPLECTHDTSECIFVCQDKVERSEWCPDYDEGLTVDLTPVQYKDFGACPAAAEPCAAACWEGLTPAGTGCFCDPVSYYYCEDVKECHECCESGDCAPGKVCFNYACVPAEECLYDANNYVRCDKWLLTFLNYVEMKWNGGVIFDEGGFGSDVCEVYAFGSTPYSVGGYDYYSGVGQGISGTPLIHVVSNFQICRKPFGEDQVQECDPWVDTGVCGVNADPKCPDGQRLESQTCYMKKVSDGSVVSSWVTYQCVADPACDFECAEPDPLSSWCPDYDEGLSIDDQAVVYYVNGSCPAASQPCAAECPINTLATVAGCGCADSGEVYCSSSVNASWDDDCHECCVDSDCDVGAGELCLSYACVVPSCAAKLDLSDWCLDYNVGLTEDNQAVVYRDHQMNCPPSGSSACNAYCRNELVFDGSDCVCPTVENPNFCSSADNPAWDDHCHECCEDDDCGVGDVCVAYSCVEATCAAKSSWAQWCAGHDIGITAVNQPVAYVDDQGNCPASGSSACTAYCQDDLIAGGGSCVCPTATDYYCESATPPGCYECCIDDDCGDGYVCFENSCVPANDCRYDGVNYFWRQRHILIWWTEVKWGTVLEESPREWWWTTGQTLACFVEGSWRYCPGAAVGANAWEVCRAPVGGTTSCTPWQNMECGVNATPPCPDGERLQRSECSSSTGETWTRYQCVADASCVFNCAAKSGMADWCPDYTTGLTENNQSVTYVNAPANCPASGSAACTASCRNELVAGGTSCECPTSTDHFCSDQHCHECCVDSDCGGAGWVCDDYVCYDRTQPCSWCWDQMTGCDSCGGTACCPRDSGGLPYFAVCEQYYGSHGEAAYGACNCPAGEVPASAMATYWVVEGDGINKFGVDCHDVAAGYGCVPYDFQYAAFETPNPDLCCGDYVYTPGSGCACPGDMIDPTPADGIGNCECPGDLVETPAGSGNCACEGDYVENPAGSGICECPVGTFDAGEGSCVAGLPCFPPCGNDLNPCTLNECDHGTGTCKVNNTVFNGNQCTDNNACTINDTCLNGVCQGGTSPCTRGECDLCTSVSENSIVLWQDPPGAYTVTVNNTHTCAASNTLCDPAHNVLCNSSTFQCYCTQNCGTFPYECGTAQTCAGAAAKYQTTCNYGSCPVGQFCNLSHDCVYCDGTLDSGAVFCADAITNLTELLPITYVEASYPGSDECFSAEGTCFAYCPAPYRLNSDRDGCEMSCNSYSYAACPAECTAYTFFDHCVPMNNLETGCSGSNEAECEASGDCRWYPEVQGCWSEIPQPDGGPKCTWDSCSPGDPGCTLEITYYDAYGQERTVSLEASYSYATYMASFYNSGMYIIEGSFGVDDCGVNFKVFRP